MKKLSSIFGALLFLFGSAGYYLFFTLADETVKDEMQEVVHAVSSTEQVIQFSFSSEELQHEVQFTQSREFIYHGEHYDVISSRKEGSRTVYHCVNDKMETSLFTWFRKNLDHQDAGNAGSKISFKPLAGDWLMPNAITFVPSSTFILFSFKSLTIPDGAEPSTITPPPNGSV